MIVGIAASAAPVIWVEAVDYHFDAVVDGEYVEHTFVIENHGDEILVIGSVRVGCGCTATILSANELAPGEATQLLVTLRTNGFGGALVSKSITVESNDPETPTLVLFLKGEVSKQPMCEVPTADLMAGFYVLVDLREPTEYADGHIIGAVNIPLSELTSWIDVLPRRVDIILYDSDGSIADTALERLVAAGVSNACALAGGLQQWIEDYGQQLVVTFRLTPSEPVD